MRMVNITTTREKAWTRISRLMGSTILLGLFLSSASAQDCSVELSCNLRINVSLDANCEAEIYPDRIHSAQDAAVCDETDFAGALDPTNWTLDINDDPATDGTVNTASAPASIEITGTTDGTAGNNSNTDYCIEVPCSGLLSFDWSAQVVGGGAQLTNDEPAYVLNGAEVILATGASSNENGTVMIDVSREDSFCFRVRSNNQAGLTTLAVSNISLISGCDYEVTIMDMDDNVIDTLPLSPDGFPIINGDFIVDADNDGVLDSFKVELNVDMSAAPCWGWMIVEDKLDPVVAQIPDITVNCDEDDSGIFEAPEPFVLTATLVDTAANDQNMMTFELGSPAMFPSPVGVISSAVLEFDADLPDDITMMEFFDASGNSIASETPSIESPEDVEDLEDMSIGDVEFPISVKVTHAGAGDMDTVEFASMSLTVEMVSYFDDEFEGSLDNCGSIEVTILDDVFIANACKDPDYEHCSSLRKITYTAFDASGNSGDTLSFYICYRKKSVFDFTIESPVKLSCEQGEEDVPGLYLEGNPFDPEYYDLCKFNVGVDDKRFDGCGSERIIERTYTIIDWCNSDLLQLVQNISFKDLDSPVIECPGFRNIPIDTIPTNRYNCLASYTVFPLDTANHLTAVEELYDNCTAFDDLVLEVDYTVSSELDPLNPDDNYKPAINNNDGSWTMPDLELGVNWIRYTVTDECDNSSYCVFEIRVTDGLPPKAICDHYTVVTLQDNGWARMLPISLDDGSYDDCGEPLIYTAKRLDDPHPCYDSPDFEWPEDIDEEGFGGYLQFCCADAGKELDVVLKVTDTGGNTATCQVIVTVQDKTTVHTTSVDEYIRINCDQYDEETLYGTPNQPTVTNSCQDFDLHYEDDPDLDDCGIGVVIRTWYYEHNGIKVYVNPSQTIYVSGIDYEILIPTTTLDANCSNFNTDLGQQPRVKVGDDYIYIEDYVGCANLSWTYEDQIFYNVEGLCMKIIRTWYVIDHCVYEPNSGSSNGSYSDTQLIKVANTDGPELSNCPEDNWFNPDPGTCATTIVLDGPDAVDGCIGEPVDDENYRYEVRREDDGSLVVAGTGRGDLLPLTIDAYRVTWFIEDFCGNVNDDCSYIVDVIDEKAPTPYCFGGITTVVMDSVFTNGNPSITVWAVDFNIDSQDDCDDDLTFAFSPDPNDNYKTFTCDSIGSRTVRIYVIDDAGNYDYCETTINIQANGDVCGNGTGPRIAGKVETWDARDVSDVQVALEHMQESNMNHQVTNDFGLYAFSDQLWSDDYQITANKSDNPLNGVSTLDIVMIQRHILGLQKLDSPYKVIAADVNNSEVVTAIDLIELRKLILGIYDKFPANESWRFVSTDQSFTDIESPWPFSEEISIHEIGQDEMYNDFVGVKVGDVNGSVQLSLLDQDTESRSARTLKLQIEESDMKIGELVKVDIRAEEFDAIVGFQFTLDHSTALNFAGIEAGALDLNESNLAKNEDLLAISWNDVNAITIGDEVLFSLYFMPVENTNSSVIFLNSEITQAEAYGAGLDVLNIELNTRSVTQELDDLVLYQNNPNPFNDMTTIEFFLPSKQEATVSIFDMNGRVIHEQSNNYNKGFNSIDFNASQKILSGVLYYKVSTSEQTASKKMLLIR